MTMEYTKKPAGAYYTSKTNREWYKERNKQIYKDKMLGMSNAELISKYQISQPRVQKIVESERRQHEFRNARS